MTPATAGAAPWPDALSHREWGDVLPKIAGIGPALNQELESKNVALTDIQGDDFVHRGYGRHGLPWSASAFLAAPMRADE